VWQNYSFFGYEQILLFRVVFWGQKKNKKQYKKEEKMKKWQITKDK
jgi:hypothetical protein